MWRDIVTISIEELCGIIFMFPLYSAVRKLNYMGVN